MDKKWSKNHNTTITTNFVFCVFDIPEIFDFAEVVVDCAFRISRKNHWEHLKISSGIKEIYPVCKFNK